MVQYSLGDGNNHNSVRHNTVFASTNMLGFTGKYKLPSPITSFGDVSKMHRSTKEFFGTGLAQGSTLIEYQQTLTTGPFGNTYGAYAVSSKVAIGGCRTQVSTTRGNTKWIQNNTHRASYSLPT
jgi:hypothetical protein